MGNPILCDDAVGIRLARRLAARFVHDDVEVVPECSVGGLNLLEVIEGYERVVVIDSIKTDGGHAGSWYRFDATSLQTTMNLRNVHDTNFATAVQLGRQMGMSLPADGDTHVIAVEIADNLSFSEEMTPELEAAFPELVDEIGAEVAGLLGAPASA